MKYLLDTNICIYCLKGKYSIDEHIKNAGPENCYISEITVAELLFGVENSQHIEANRRTLDDFLHGFHILPVFHSLELYAKEKVRLRKAGIMLDDFDILIGTTAVVHQLIMVTKNVNHFQRIKDIVIEDWTQSYK